MKAERPSLSRRTLLLLIADEFWSLDEHKWTALAAAVRLPRITCPAVRLLTVQRQADSPPLGPPPWTHETDEYDITADDDGAAPPGIIVRTDYSTGSDDAWATFCIVLRDAEREFFADQVPPTVTVENSDDADGEGSDDGASTDSDESSPAFALFAPLSDPVHFGNISNLRALRLLFDVSVRVTPGQPVARGEGGAQHRLSGLRGLQETYDDARGRTLWIFDARSRVDGCARLVSEAGDIAT